VQIYEFIRIFSYALVGFIVIVTVLKIINIINCGEFLDSLRNFGFQKGLDSRELVS